mgnify:CR=1 FL=1|tara:strand:- start:32753 stop:33574 length:822 start_codon:yes stop_codon:yes gene_type:complete
MANIKMKALRNPPVFRKIAFGSWSSAADPSVYGSLSIDMTRALEFIDKQSLKGHKITPTHLVGRAVSLALKARPELNAMIRCSRVWLRDEVTLFYQVNIPGPKGHEIERATLSGVTIEQADQKSVEQIAIELAQKAKAVREGTDKVITKNTAVFKYLPWSLCRIYLNFASWLIYGLNLNLTRLGLPNDPFGSVMITSVGGLGIDWGFAPLIPYTRVPLLISVGKVDKRPWVVADQVAVRPVLELGVTLDHRIIDGVHAAELGRMIKEYMADPS